MNQYKDKKLTASAVMTEDEVFAFKSIQEAYDAAELYAKSVHGALMESILEARPDLK